MHKFPSATLPVPLLWTLARISRLRLVRKLGWLSLSLNDWIWNRIPPALRRSGPVRRYGRFIHRLVLIRGLRHPNHGTFLLRNRPELELIHELAGRKPKGSPFRIAVLGCSVGMEVYSIRWRLRGLAPQLDIRLLGLELDQRSLDIARAGTYRLREHAWMLTRLTDAERADLLEVSDDLARIRPHLREGIEWVLGDACDPALDERLGPQDLVLANRFLCHMQPAQARACLRNIMRLVAPGGTLFVSGVDLDVRQSVLRDSRFVPLTERLEEIHDGDPSLHAGWPLRSWGLEPLDRNRVDWVSRYAMVYRNDDRPREWQQRESVGG